ncbi:Os10g0519500 [Oryza sativa Japonica Group]|uniref:Expressed protein n=2 Tax=Oryza sativa subsp. japonica TaxID=39947 RepID=Q337B0_ORYSJ|nr:expressed protein [Oryza sativa Japonica Group]BAF26993.1 Os10g0519500 [Oryza sativa Japonica Group]BAG98649.1 unnamed protein product [Oryza sativa Japonica Group]BAT11685.1 Os10g0519500 [Oryza sativa Japonica Group]|eukprot:NP_001065079.1 Os10g0519500 [Oryza sativa Japonica Group]
MDPRAREVGGDGGGGFPHARAATRRAAPLAREAGSDGGGGYQCTRAATRRAGTAAAALRMREAGNDGGGGSPRTWAAMRQAGTAAAAPCAREAGGDGSPHARGRRRRWRTTRKATATPPLPWSYAIWAKREMVGVVGPMVGQPK